MDWKISDVDKIFSIDLAERDGLITVSSINVDGENTELPEVIISNLDDRSRVSVDINGNLEFAHVAKVRDKWWIHYNGDIFTISELERGAKSSDKAEGGLSAPMPGTVLDVMVREGQRVREGQPLMTIEAMKMEHRITAPRDGIVGSVQTEVGEQVENEQLLVTLEDEEGE